MADTQLDLIDSIDELKQKSMSAAEKIIAAEAHLQRENLISWIKEDEQVKIVIAFSGGKDSIYMVLYYLFELKIPAERIELWHHDVDGHGEQLFDWKVTPEYCMAFAKAFGLKLLFSYRKNGIVGRLLRHNEPLQDVYYQTEPGGEYRCAPSDPARLNTGGRWMQVGSDMKLRWCSSTVKIEVAQRVLTNDPRFQGTKENPVKVVFSTGERHDESNARRNLKEIEVYRGKSIIAHRQVVLWRLNVDVTERMVWDMMEKHKVQPHPCYMIGWNRCSCQLCIFNSEEYWNALLHISPEKIMRIRELEEKTASINASGTEHTLYDKLTIYEKAVRGTGNLINLNDPETQYWVKQATEKFTHSIIVEDWKMPPGAFSKLTCGAS